MKTKGGPKVTVITPVYNGQAFVKSFFDGLLLQKYYFKVIVINDASCDETGKLLIEFQRKMPFEVDIVTETSNIGPGAARFKAISRVDTEFIAFCDIDDVWPEQKLLVQLGELQKSDASWSYHGRHILINGEPTGQFIEAKPIDTMFKILTTRYVGLSSVVIRTDIAAHLPSLEGEYLAEDLIWWSHLMARSGPPLAIYGVFYDYNIHKGSSSLNKLKMAVAAFDVYCVRNVVPVSRSFAFIAFVVYAFSSIAGIIARLK